MDLWSRILSFLSLRKQMQVVTAVSKVLPRNLTACIYSLWIGILPSTAVLSATSRLGAVPREDHRCDRCQNSLKMSFPSVPITQTLWYDIFVDIPVGINAETFKLFLMRC